MRPSGVRGVLLSFVLLASCGSDHSLVIGATVGGEGIEIFDLATSARVPLASTTTQVTGGDGYTFQETYYDLRALPLDAYLAVHFRSAGAGDPYTSDEESAFTTFDGEPALVTTVHVLR